MSIQVAASAGILDRVRIARAADWLAVAVAVSLPWSTSASGVLIALWLVAVIPTLDLTALRRVVAMPAGCHSRCAGPARSRRHDLGRCEFRRETRFLQTVPAPPHFSAAVHPVSQLRPRNVGAGGVSCVLHRGARVVVDIGNLPGSVLAYGRP